MPRKQVLTQSEIASIFKNKLADAVTRPTIYNYVPHTKQVKFHSSRYKGRLLLGGNRSGKTVGGIAEDVHYLRGEHPYKRVPPPPVRGRIVTTSYTEGLELIIIPELRRWLPPSALKNGSWEDSYQKNLKLLTLDNGSTCQLMSYEQKLEQFAGASRHFVHFDEEPPKDIFNECKARLVDTDGDWWITMTPVEGMTWLYDDIFMQVMEGKLDDVEIIVVDMTDNPHLSEAAVDRFLAGLDEDEVKARKKGEFVQLGGRAFPNYLPHLHYIDELDIVPPDNWTHYASMDHGLNNPTAWLFHAVSPSGAVITYDEIYDREKVVSYYATEIHKRNLKRKPPDFIVGDPAIAQRNGQTGDSIQTAYAQHGIFIALGNNSMDTVEKMNRYLQQGKWAITANCPNLHRQLQRNRWEVYESAKKRRDSNLKERIHKKDEHATDGARYFFGVMPDLYISPQQDRTIEKINQTIREALTPVTTPIGPTRIDYNLRRTQWTNIDEHLGGIW